MLALLFASSVSAEPCNIYFFYSDTCPHCAHEKVFLTGFSEKYPEVEIQWIEYSQNYEMFEQLSEKLGTVPVGVPRTYINGTAFVGYTDEYGEMEYMSAYKAYNGYRNQIEKALIEHAIKEHNISINQSCEDMPETKQSTDYFTLPLVLILLFMLFAALFRKKIKARFMVGAGLATLIVILFYISQHIPSSHIVQFAGQFSFPVFTIVIALLDGFNPCAFAVLAILLSLLIYAKSKGKMALIGVIFITTSSIMYFLFIVILLVLRAELLGQYKGIIRIAVGLIALIAGAINIKDFFFFKQGISLTISGGKMSRIMQKMKGIVNEVREANTPFAMAVAVISTIVLAAFVNLVELGCTLILPVQYIEVLVTNYGSNIGPTHYFFIALYCIVYVIPLFFILGSFLYTFKSERMTEQKGKIMKLIGGLIMLGLGLILLLRPELLVFG